MVKLVVSFNRRDLIIKLALQSISVHSITTSLNDIPNLRRFELEVFRKDSGKFEPIDDHTLLNLGPVVRVLVVEPENGDGKLMAIKGRNFDLARGLPINQHLLRIVEEENAHLGTGLITWDGSVVLAKFMEINKNLVLGKNIIEVGAGTGVAGIAAFVLGGKKVVLTDLKYSLKNLIGNLEINFASNSHEFSSSPSSIHVAELDWFDPSTFNADSLFHISADISSLGVPITPSTSTLQNSQAEDKGWDVILGADVVWLEHLVGPLVSALCALAAPRTLLLIAHQTRSERTDALLFSSLTEAGFNMTKIPLSDHHPEFKTEKIGLFWGKKAT